MGYADAGIGVGSKTMSANLPGAWVYGFLAQWLDETSLHGFVAPTVADLQYEVRQAGGNQWRRGLARIRGYSALGRVVAVHCTRGRSPMRRLLAILLFGSAGAASLVAAQSATTIGPVQVSPYFVAAIAVPIVFRVLELGRNYRQMFVNCVAVGIIMAMTQYGWLMLVYPRPSIPVYVHLLTVPLLLGCVAFVSAIAAAVAWKPPTADEPAFRRILICLAAGCAAFVITYSGIGLWFAKDATRLASVLSWAAFLGFFFAAVSGGVHLPILLGARQRLTGRASLALVGAMLFPVPMLGFAFLQGRLASTWAYWLREPTALIANILPFAVAGAVLGWVIAARPPQATTVAQ
jgi:hypothetical protein